MKLSDVAYETESPKQVEILDHNGRPFSTRALISVLSWKSKTGAKALTEMQREILLLGDAAENLEEKRNAILRAGVAKLITGWSGIEDENGKAIKFTPANVEKVLAYPYIFDTIDRFASNLGNFLAGPSKTF